MHPVSNTIPDCQSPANDAAGVVAAKPDAGGGVGPYILFADCDGHRLAVGDTVEVLTLPGTRLVIAELLLCPISVVVDGEITFPVCEFVYVDQGGSLTVFYASKVKKITPVVEPEPEPAPELGVCAPEYCRYCGFLVLTPCDMPPADVCDDALSALYERRRMSAAAAHAYEMQSGPCAPELCPPVGNTGITGFCSTPDPLTSGVKK